MTETIQEASSSSSSTSTCVRCDVFLNFRGADTRNNFISFLYKALKKKGVNVFIDDESIKFGEPVSPSLMKAIQGSKISIPVISSGYSSSKWCLKELSLMLDCYKSNGQIVLPIFFDVDPSDVRNQAGSFGALFQKDEKKFEPQDEESWRKALREVGSLKGWVHREETGSQAELVDLVVERVLNELECGNHLVTCKYPIGIDPHVTNMISSIKSDSNDVQFVGICGPGGVGKTTVAKAVYNQILSKFSRHCFLSDVREQAMQSKGLASLQKQLLKDISKIDIDIGDHHEGKSLIKKMLCKEKVLLVLDNVGNKEQLDALVGELDWFGKGSKVIMTAREQHILQVAKVDKDKIYSLQKLNPTDSLQLFSLHAFSEREPPNDYMQLSQDVAQCLGGLPLTIEVLGSSLSDIRDKEVWESTLQKLKEILDHEEVERMLKISYDNLEDNCQKSMFLDSACYFIGWEKETIVSIWEACGYHPKFTVHTLVKRSLLKFEYNEYGACCLSMHDQIRDMGRNIVLKENCMEPSNHNKLWSNGEIWRLLRHKGADKIKGMILPIRLQSVPLSSECFENLGLLFLDINSVHFGGAFPSLPSTLKWFRWKSCPLHSLPANFYHGRLVNLDLSCSMIKQAWNIRSQDKNELFHDLKVLILSDCIYLAKSPDFSLFPHLERLDLGNCRSLDNVDESIGQLSQLKILILKCCDSLKRLPDSIGDLKFLVQLDLSGSGLEELPDSICKLIFLEEMNLRDCRSLEKLPDGVGLLEKLVRLDAEGCYKLKKLPTSMRRMGRLHTISLKGDGISNIPDDFSMLLNVFVLKMTATVPSLPTDLLSHWRYLKQLNFFNCVKLEYLPKLPSSLVELCCEDCFSLVQLPDLSLLNILAILCIAGCVNLEEIRGLEEKLSLVEFNARGCHNLTIPPRKILGQGTLLPNRPLGGFSLSAIDGIYKKRLILCLVFELPSDFRSKTIYCDISASIRHRGKTTSCVHTLRIEDVEFTTHPHIIYLHHFKGFDWFGIPLHGKDAIENLHIHQSNLPHQLSLDNDASRAYCRVKFWKLLLDNMEPIQQEHNRHSIAMKVAEFFIFKFENRGSEPENHNRDTLMAADFSNWSFENREYEHQMLNQHASAMRVADFFDCTYDGVGGSRATARLVLEDEEHEEDEAPCPSPGQETQTETGSSSNGSNLIDSNDEALLTAIRRIVLENEEEEGVSRAMERLFLGKDDDAAVAC